MRWKRGLGALGILAGGILLLWQQQAAVEGVRAGLSLCGTVVIPSLFPFLALASLLVRGGFLPLLARPLRPLARLLRLPAQAVPLLLLSAVGGYPAAAGAIARMAEEGGLDRDTAARMLCFSVNAGPAFLIGSIGGGMFGDARIGWLLYAACLLAALCIALFSRPRRAFSSMIRSSALPVPFSHALVGAVADAASGILSICAYLLLFSALSALLQAAGLFERLGSLLASLLPTHPDAVGLFAALSTGLLEVTGGCAAAAGRGGMAALLLCAFFCGFGGFSVQCQILAAVSKAGIPTLPFLFSRPLQGALSCGMLLLLLQFFPIELPVFASAAAPLPVPFSVSAPASIAMLMLGAVCLLSPRCRAGDRPVSCRPDSGKGGR